MLALPAPSLFWYPLLAALIPLLLAVSAWPRRFARGVRTFIACQFPLALIFVAQVLIRTSSGLPAKTVLYQLWTVAAVWTAFLGLLFSLEYTGRSKRFPRWALLVVALPLVGLSALIMTNSVTGWIWQRFWDDGWLRTDLTALGFAGMIYVCLLSVSCTVILFVVAARARRDPALASALSCPLCGLCRICLRLRGLPIAASSFTGHRVYSGRRGAYIRWAGSLSFPRLRPDTHRGGRPGRANESRYACAG